MNQHATGSGTRIVLSGGSGLIGDALKRSLERDGAEVTQLVRHRVSERDRARGYVQWNPGGTLDPAVLAGARAVVNLNGASIGKLPWTRDYRRVLVSSRLDSTRTIARALRELGGDAPAFVSASAVGYYGNRPDPVLTEDSAPGGTFLAKLCVRWEEEALAAADVTRVALLRTAPVLHPEGVLKPMLTLTKLGLGGPLGAGTQVWPWISLVDEVRAIRHVIDREISGPVNLTGPMLASQNTIGRALAQELSRPYLLPVPGFALRLAVGRDAADSLLLTDARATPAVLERTGFVFRHNTAQAAIADAV